jgi:hypothetical protein
MPLETGLRASAPGPKAKPVVQYDTEPVKAAKPVAVEISRDVIIGPTQREMSS